MIQCTNCNKNIRDDAFNKHIKLCKYSNKFTKNAKNPNNNDEYEDNPNINNIPNNKSSITPNIKNNNTNKSKNVVNNERFYDPTDIPIKPGDKNIFAYADENNTILSKNTFDKYNDKYNDDDEYNDDIQLIPCNSCGRSFNPNSISKHMKVCKKVFVEKRKEFNSKDQRKNEDITEIENKDKNNKMRKKKTTVITKEEVKEITNHLDKPVNKIPKWKMQSEMFRRAIGKGGGSSNNNNFGGDNNQQIEDMDSRVQCKFCKRKFNEDRFDKHYQVCLNKSKIVKK